MNRLATASICVSCALMLSAFTYGCGDDTAGNGGAGGTASDGPTSTSKSTGASPTTAPASNSHTTGATPTTSPASSSTGILANDCATYCSLIQTSCTTDNAQYASDSECMTACTAFAPGTPGEATHDTLACRITHATSAEATPATECPNAGPTGGTTCVD